MKKKNKIYKRILIALGLFFALCTLYSQQKTLNKYKNDQKYYEEQIAKENENKDELISMEDNVNSKEYIEEVAREKLDMYLPNERVYVDVGK